MSILELTLSMSSKTSNFAIMAGASSMIFWCLLWMEQSRPNNDIALPYWSAKSWTSKCLAHLANFIINIGDPGTSAWTYWNIIIISLIHFYLSWFLPSFPPPLFSFTCLNWLGNSSPLSTLRIPFPPPPSDAFIMTGNPIFCAAAKPSSTVCTQPSL